MKLSKLFYFHFFSLYCITLLLFSSLMIGMEQVVVSKNEPCKWVHLQKWVQAAKHVWVEDSRYEITDDMKILDIKNIFFQNNNISSSQQRLCALLIEGDGYFLGSVSQSKPLEDYRYLKEVMDSYNTCQFERCDE